MSFKLDLKKKPTYTVKHGELEVKIQPLNKREDVKLVDEFTKGKVRVLQGERKKGFRKKERDELLLPEIDYVELNLERAIKTWKTWNVDKFPCNKENITLMFENRYEEFVVPILDKLDEMVNDEKGPEGEDKDEEVKP